MTALKTRAAALAALAAALLLFGIVVVTPVVAAFSAQSDDTGDALQQLGRYRAEIGAKPVLEAALRDLNRKGASVPGVVEGESVALAQAQLQSQIKAVVETSSGSVRSMQILPVTQKAGFDVIAVQCDLAIPQNKLEALAYAIAAHAPYLFVDEASITAPPADLDSPQAHDVMLDVRWTVHGYRWGRTK
ncbi:MAG TPA: type II secretion system protein GspM [Rhizomicrobium sp.]|nr:type II secretion system protein GspM [Rhizomicrobium sp.]